MSRIERVYLSAPRPLLQQVDEDASSATSRTPWALSGEFSNDVGSDVVRKWTSDVYKKYIYTLN